MCWDTSAPSCPRMALRSQELNHSATCHLHRKQPHPSEALHEVLAVVEADAAHEPGAMVVHVQATRVTDGAMVCAFRPPNIAELAVAFALCILTHVETPVPRHMTRTNEVAHRQRAG
mmetsp:Transcript_27469/g.53692  ORF Transcript_27469/g.53692 Transcript_27469/m.53692 type:complete len:117 (+) Transcript_27469:1338-1688(+)